MTRIRQWLDGLPVDEARRAELHEERRRRQASMPPYRYDPTLTAPPASTPAAVVSSRPTVPRVAGGMLLGGVPGAILGFAWRKKQKIRVRP